MIGVLIAITVILFILAIFTIVPALPIVPVQFLIILMYGIFSGFSILSFWMIVVFAVLASLSLLVDYSAGAIGAKIGGAHRYSVLAGIVGGLLGTFFLPPFGAFLGIPLGVFLSEKLLRKNTENSARSAGFSLAGAIGGVFLNGFLAFTTAILFLVFVF